ncbi:Nitric oxide-associated protein 1 [Eumeta japonica]|uniref:Nitric oxide-associated protein 1 n=1 Tax=Eumeta variegata TaxID=151549 RepID=A0A4C1YSK0_EUMVA|nr:Nitric oxide-associated protein 1 [Eumeta japonica]
MEVIKKMEVASSRPLPISLKYFVEKERLLEEEIDESLTEPEPEKQFHLPFAKTSQLSGRDNVSVGHENILKNENQFDRSNIGKWMTNYEYFDDTKLNESEWRDDESDEVNITEWSKYYGTPDPNEKVSTITCGGCGAFMHCSDTSIPGYLPSEIFKGRSPNEMKEMECQRCHFLKEYNIALDVNVEPEEYEKLLESIRHVKSLVVMMVDLLDFPCSIWPGIVDIIGTNRPIIIVGNKVDLIPGDSVGYLKRIENSLIRELKRTKLRDANIKHVSLISAKTGYGVEELITAMFETWLAKGDVFLIGCTNVGKSSLFNALLQSDYCKVHAVDIIKRATVSRWPGTTLNLLKFPINRPSDWKIYTRTHRLKSEAKLLKLEEEIRKNQLGGKNKFIRTLIGHIGRTFSNPRHLNELTHNKSEDKPLSIDERDPIFAKSKWFYDTPGVIHPDQVLSFLTTEELILAIPKQTIKPKTYYLFKGHTIFIGGLARVDFVDCTEACRFTVFCSNELPITITKTEDACEIYEAFLGTDLFGVPIGGKQRLSNWPGLQCHPTVLEFNGEGPKVCCGDLVLSTIGWVSITAKKDTICKVIAWTMQARGIHIRHPSMLPFAINLKGRRIQNTPAYGPGRVFTK